MPVEDENEQAILRRLHRVEGQVRGIIRMVEEGEDCEDVLTQVAAARSAMNRIGIQIIPRRMKECFEDNPPDSLQEAIGEAIDIFLRFSSSIGPTAPE